MTQQSLLIVWLAGILALVAGFVMTRLNWRQDVTPFGRGSKTIDILVHTQKYARPDSLRVIIMINRFGWACLSIGAALLVYQTVIRSIPH